MSQEFVKVAQAGDLPPGKMKTVKLGNTEVLLVNVDGSYYAVADTCTHAYASLSEGDLIGDEVECPLHASAFSVKSGEVLGPPAIENLAVYTVRVEGEDILIAPS